MDFAAEPGKAAVDQHEALGAGLLIDFSDRRIGKALKRMPASFFPALMPLAYCHRPLDSRFEFKFNEWRNDEGMYSAI